MMDNFRIDITSVGDMTKAMELCFDRYTSVVAYRIDEKLGLIFYKTDPGRGRIEVVKLPFKLDSVGAADFAKRWLAELDYGEEPDHDGDNRKGWRLYNEAWGHIAGEWEAFVAIKPAWAMYGK